MEIIKNHKNLMTHRPTNNTIIAQCTPHGAGALALLRLSGEHAIAIASRIGKLAGGRKPLSSVESHTVHFGTVVNGNEVVDEVLFIVMKGPRTFTGEDVVEITCHNNPFIIEKVIALATAQGARVAQRGEFAQQAFLNNKLDLSQAEAINALIGAHTEQALKKSLAQLQGSFSSWLANIEKELLHCLVLNEASFEFLDDETIEFAPQIVAQLSAILDQITKVKASFALQQQIKEGVRVAILGSVNAGKSSLFNALLKKNRAIVTDIAGTTRDSIEAGIYREQYYLTLIDTAGLREAEDVIEQIGIKRSFDEANVADIVLLVFDNTRALTTAEKQVYTNLYAKYEEKTICVINKADAPTKLILDAAFKQPLHTAAEHNSGINQLEQHIIARAKSLIDQDKAPFLLNQRQFTVLTSTEEQIQKALTHLQNQTNYELAAIHLNDALQLLAGLTGKSISEQGLDVIFREFCVGK